MTDFRYAPIPPDDLEQFMMIEAEAFGSNLQQVRQWLNGEHGGELRGLYRDGQLVAQLILIPFDVQAGHGTLACGGIGSVASPPEARRRGYIGQILREVVDEMLSRKIALSILHPFKAGFYRQFGWATFEERRSYSGPIEALAPFRRHREGHFERVGVEAIGELDAIYRNALRGRFGPIVRSEGWWKRDLLRPEKGNDYAFIWRDDAGSGRSYCIYKWEQRPAGLTMVCREAAALDPIARAQLFGFMADHDNQCREVAFSGPGDAPVNAVLPEPFRANLEPFFMLRLLDVAAALAAFPYPKDCTGRITLAVEDNWLSNNQGVFEIEVADGSAQCRRLADDAPADIACDVRVLAQIYSRFVRPRSAAAFGLLGVRERGAISTLEAMFAGLMPFCSDYF